MKTTHFGNFVLVSSEFLVGVTTTPTNYGTFLTDYARIMLTTNITYYAGSSARIIAASLPINGGAPPDLVGPRPTRRYATVQRPHPLIMAHFLPIMQ